MSFAPEIDGIAGRWTYRSFVSDPNPKTGFDDLRFGAGTLTIEKAPTGVLRGTLGDTGWQLAVAGSVGYGDPFTVRFQGRGDIGGEEWVYDYSGWVVPAWPWGVDQVPAITGTIVRTVPHSGGAAPAGVVAQWIAVRQGT